MVCNVDMRERPKLNDPVLIEGLPGIGFVANITANHLIRELNAIRFAEIRSSSFQDYAVTVEDGEMRYPTNELYYYRGAGEERDLIILYGNTQALTTQGQYELCNNVLDVCQELGCSFVVTLGGLKREKKIEKPKIYFAATDKETVNMLLESDAEVIKGQIFGVAGLLVGIGRLRGFHGFCLLAETLGFSPDSLASVKVLNLLCRLLHLKVNVKNVDSTVKITRSLLENFGLIEHSGGNIRKKESQFRWFI